MQEEKLNKVFRSDLLPLEIKWSYICAGKEMRYNQRECVMEKTGCCGLNECARCGCIGVVVTDQNKIKTSSSCPGCVSWRRVTPWSWRIIPWKCAAPTWLTEHVTTEGCAHQTLRKPHQIKCTAERPTSKNQSNKLTN